MTAVGQVKGVKLFLQGQEMSHKNRKENWHLDLVRLGGSQVALGQEQVQDKWQKPKCSESKEKQRVQNW